MSDTTYRPVPSIFAARPRFTKPFAQHIGLTPRHALAARRQAERQESVGAYEEAVRLWQLAILIEPESNRAFIGLARSLRALERDTDANAIENVHVFVTGERPS
jgi:tetratricopeptide (TPR) repeat protein